MITRLHVRRFRSIRALDLELSPLTALVGPNGSGKSTVLAALNPRNELTPTWRHEREAASVERITNVGTTISGHVNGLFPTLGVQTLRLELDALRRESIVERASILSSNGSNISNVIGSMTRERQALLASEFSKRIPAIRDLDVFPTTSGKHQLRFHDRWSETEFSPDEVSDGTLLLLAFLAAKFQPTRPDILAVEEPERGLHPYLLGELVRLLRELTTGPNALQVVLATHSAELLEHLNPAEVRFLSRSPDDGNVLVRSVDPTSADWPRYFREFDDSLGGAWLSGGLGGTPQSH